MRNVQFYEDPEINRRFLNAIDSYQTGTKVVADEEEELVFSRKDRKAYRQAVLRKRTESQPADTQRKASTLG